MQNKIYKNFLRNYYLSSALNDFIFAYAVYSVIFNINGLSVFQISILFAWWAISSLLFEIPSGALADHWSRKKLLISAPIIKSFCFLIWILADGNFYLYALGFLFWSISGSFRSGTQEALLYDNLVFFKKKKDYQKILGRKKFYMYIVLALSMIIGGFIAHVSLDLVLLASIFPLYFSSFFASQLHEAPKIKSTEEVNYLDHIKIAWREIKVNKVLIYLMIYLVGIEIFGSLEEFNGLYYRSIDLPIFSFGILEFSWTMLSAIGSYYAYKFSKWPIIFVLSPLINIFLFLIISWNPVIQTVALLILTYGINSPLSILVDNKIQDNIKSNSRATIISAIQFMIGFICILIMPLIGWINKLYGFPVVYLFVGGWLLVLTVWTIFNKKIFLKNTYNKP